jgi:hypothetical protein
VKIRPTEKIRTILNENSDYKLLTDPTVRPNEWMVRRKSIASSLFFFTRTLKKIKCPIVTWASLLVLLMEKRVEGGASSGLNPRFSGLI